MTKAEQQEILIDWNKTENPTPSHLCAHELFEMRVKENPNQPALIFEENSLSYLELDQRSNQLANYLKKLEVSTESIVGISTDRSFEMIVAILGVMKAGAAYLPLDPNYPPERLSFMFDDFRISVLLSQKTLDGKLPTHQSKTIWLDTDWKEISNEFTEKPSTSVKPENLAYVIYTSGSTGKPKGTLLTHKGLSNLAEAQRLAFNIRSDSKILQFSPFSFDASVWETFMALANGATLCLIRQEYISSGPELVRVINKLKVTNITMPPSVLRILPEEELPSLETIIAAGEACTPDLVAKWAKNHQFINAYGPTETTVCASMYQCDPIEVNPPPIGKPILNTKLYIFDQNQQPLPIGIPGELYISGISLARGYLNQPETTKEKFILNRFNLSERLYRTGDLVKYKMDGNIEFLGRVDQQVKLRGFRIELGEIESVIAGNFNIKECVVTLKEGKNGEKRIVAYIIPAQNQSITSIELKDFLRNSLPDYMIPSSFVFLETFPISPSGKVDRNALPEPEFDRANLASDYISPRDEQETRLCQICSELLHIQNVGINDNFFELGGHSLLATQFISRIRDDFKVEISVRSLFENPTVSGISQQITQLVKPEESETDRITRLLAQIDQLSEEEIHLLLADKKGLIPGRKVEE